MTKKTMILCGIIAMVMFSFFTACKTDSFDLAVDKTAKFSIIPEPVNITPLTGEFIVDNGTGITASPELATLKAFIKGDLSVATGFSLDSINGNLIELKLNKSLIEKIGEEGYQLLVSPETIVLEAATEAGIFYGYQTLKQLFPKDIFNDKTNASANINWTVPAVEIMDYPNFSWRGMHLDVARHFFKVSDVKRFIDMLAMHKMNIFHWHLTEDQGWRIEIKQYPLLTSEGSIRPETVIDHNNTMPRKFDGKPYGGFYTQEDVKEIVAYATARHITVVPEIEMPGHAQAALSAYPEFGNTGEDVKPWTQWGVSKNVFNVQDETIEFLQNILDEVIELFPSEFIHIGGDECPKDQWESSESAQARIKSEGLDNEHELQSWYIKKMDTYLASKGKRLIGWDEILEGGLAPGAAVMSWRGDKGGIAAAKAGHDVVMAPTHSTYFDFYQGASNKEPLAIGGFTNLKKVYAWTVIPKKLNKDQERFVLGGQAQLWSEYMKDIDHVLYMAWPRGSALAEVLWSQKEKKSYSKFSYKLKQHQLRMAASGASFRYPDCCSKTVSYTLKANEDSISISLPESKNGFYQIFINSNSGSPLTISQAILKIDGNIIDSEIHEGYSGEYDQGSIFTLSAGKSTAKGECTINISATADSKASGKILIKRL